MTAINYFNIRVYGIYINEKNEILISDEYIYKKYVTKFPGGGLIHGEGIKDGLLREMVEETGQSFTILQHFYTTDFFVQSAFNPMHQVVSIYYLVKPVDEIKFKISDVPFDFEKEKKDGQSFRFVKAAEINPDDFELIIDRTVAQLLKEKFS